MTKVIECFKLANGVILDELPTEFYQDVRETYEGSCHSKVDKIWIRKPERDTQECYQESFDTVDVLDIFPVKALICHIKASLDFGQVGRVIVTRLKAGDSILKHRDEGMYAENTARFHAILKGSCLWVGEEDGFLMEEGSVYMVPHLFEHEVIAIKDRIALVFDLEV